MWKIRALLLLMMHYYISWTFRNKLVFVVAGLRRSGNHAFINWLSNSLEQSNADFSDIGHGRQQTKTKRLLFFNEVNFYGPLLFIDAVRASRKQIKEARFVIISLEDHIPKKKDEYIPKKANKIAIQRSILNLIASRIQRAKNLAEQVLDRGDMRIDTKFVAALRWIETSQSKGWVLWNYDEWVVPANQVYRENFLKLFSLESWQMPAISTQGDGSSFTGQSSTPNATDVLNRWRQIEWPERVVNLLKDDLISNSLTEAESEFIRSQSSNGR